MTMKSGNINDIIICQDAIELHPLRKTASGELTKFEELFKEDLKKSRGFEFFYCVKETEARYKKIHLNYPLFYGIILNETFIGYIGFSLSGENEIELEIYLLQAYRNKGYAKIALKALLAEVTAGRLKVYENNKIKTLIPKLIKADVRIDNKPSIALLESCGFKIPIGFIMGIISADDNRCEEDIEYTQYVYDISDSE